ncbi:MAG: lysophospholipid acyltransferase family protein [Pseudomonadota bacterium]
MKSSAQDIVNSSSLTWHGDPPPPRRTRGAWDWLRIVRRGVPLALTVFGGLALLVLLRLIEAPLFNKRRPITPWITRGVCVAALWWLGMGRRVDGAPMEEPGAGVANHISWLDIFALNAGDCIYFVAKAEVAGWPAIGWLARATGTVFIRRARAEAPAQAQLLERRLAAGHRLLIFPEGTSTDGLRVLAFRPTLFAPFFASGLPSDLHVQPITVRYEAPPGEDPRYYGWWGDMGFAESLIDVLALPRPGRVVLRYNPPLAVADFADRKSLARAAEAAVRSGLGA